MRQRLRDIFDWLGFWVDTIWYGWWKPFFIIYTLIITYEAIGAGLDYALAALYLGHTVEDSVKTACELSVYCEQPIIYMTMDRSNE